jgi:hypothetical protein
MWAKLLPGCQNTPFQHPKLGLSSNLFPQDSQFTGADLEINHIHVKK